ncbi:MAG TPA: hypothetical protein ENK18_27925 [Deltaproteobacteria bacterium]|nr:hypothetical protein [Deltaproteobacteria bacterium]
MLWWLALGCAPVDAPWSEVTIYEPGRSQLGRGKILFTAFDAKGDESWALRIDVGGRVDWSAEGDPGLRILRAKPSRDGTSVLYAINDPLHVQELGVILREPVRGGPITLTTTAGIHHDFVELDRQLAFLEHRFAQVDVGSRSLPLASDRVRIVAEGSDDAGQVELDLLKDYPTAPWWTCDHMEYGHWIPEVFEWSHSNSLIEPPGDPSTWWLMPRYFDAILEMDRSSGEVRWQLGGRDNTFELGPGARPEHAHASHAFDDRLLIFDNGSPHGGERPTSRVIELQIDRWARRAELVWEHPEPEGRHVGFLGDARRLPGGNTLIAWGPLGTITEVTPGGEIVWELQLELSIGRISYWR